MRIVGIRRSADALVEVATLSEDGTQVAVLASLIEFWADPAVVLAAPNPGATLPTAQVTLVPPVLPDARVICIGLNYLKHVAEGSYRDQDLRNTPRCSRGGPALTVDGAEVPVPDREDGLDWEGEIVAWVGSRWWTPPRKRPWPRSSATRVQRPDVTLAQKLTSQWILGKNADRSGPLGPMVPPARSRT